MADDQTQLPGGFNALPEDSALANFIQRAVAKGDENLAFAAVPARGLIPLFNPDAAPWRGMYSALTPSALKSGQWSLAQNVRPDDGSMKTRQPTINLNASGLSPVTSFRGLWSGTLNGTPYVVYAGYDGSKVRIYDSTDGISYSELSSSTTRFNDSTGSIPFTFQAINWNVTGNDYLIVQNGVDSPRVWDPTNGFFIHQSISLPPTSASAIQPTAKMGNYVSLGQISAGIGTSTWNSTTVQSGKSSGSNSSSTLNDTTKTWSVNAYAGLSITIYYGTGSGSLGVHVTRTVASNTSTQITITGTWPVTPDATSYYLITSATPRLALSNTSGGVAPQYESMLVKTTVSQNDWAMIEGTIDCSTSPQICFATDYATYDQFTKLKLELFDTVSTTWYTVYDPTVSTMIPPQFIPWADSHFDNATAGGMGLNGEQIVVYDLSNIASTNRTNAQFWRWTWAQGASMSTTDYTFNIHLMFCSGTTLYGASFGQAAYNSNSFAESAFVANGLTLMPNGASVGLQCGGTTGGGTNPPVYTIRLPGSTSMLYDYTVPAYTAAAADVTNGVNGINIYRQDTGQTDYFYVGNCASAGSLSVTSATPQNVQRPAGDAFSTTVPTGTAMAYANQRTFVGGKSKYNFSESNNPFRFRQLLKITNGVPQNRSAGYVALPAETVAAFATAAASPVGAAQIFMFTDRNTYSIGGFSGFALSQPTLIAAVGCSAPQSVAQYKDAIFFLDDNQQVRRFSYGKSHIYMYENANAYDLMLPISRRIVSDVTTNIPASRLAWATGLAKYDRYYLALTPQGGTHNTLILVWDETVGTWVEDTLPKDAEGMVVAPFTTGAKILLASSDIKIYEHENATSLNPLAVRLTSRELHTGMWHNMFYGRIGMVVDTNPGSIATLTKTVKNGALGTISNMPTTDGTTLNLALNSPSQIWRWDVRADAAGNPTPGGIQGASCQIDFQASMLPGSRIYSMVIETDTAQPGADAA